MRFLFYVHPILKMLKLKRQPFEARLERTLNRGIAFLRSILSEEVKEKKMGNETRFFELVFFFSFFLSKLRKGYRELRH